MKRFFEFMLKIKNCLIILLVSVSSHATQLVNAEGDDQNPDQVTPALPSSVQQRFPLEKLFLGSPITDIPGRPQDRESFCKKMRMPLDQCLGMYFKRNGRDIPFRYCAAYVCDAMLTYEPQERRTRCLRAIQNRHITCEEARICERFYQDPESLIACFDDLSKTSPPISPEVEEQPRRPQPGEENQRHPKLPDNGQGGGNDPVRQPGQRPPILP